MIKMSVSIKGMQPHALHDAMMAGGPALKRAVFEVNDEWAGTVRDAIAAKLLANLQRDAALVDVTPQEYFFPGSSGNTKYSADELANTDSPINKPVSEMNAEELEVHSQFHFWRQGVLDKISNVGKSFNVHLPPFQRVKYQIPFTMFPEGTIDLRKETDKSEFATYIKYLPRELSPALGTSIMGGDWINPATTADRGGHSTWQESQMTHDFGDDYPGWLEENAGGQDRQVRLRPDDPIFINNILIKIAGEEIDSKLIVLQKMHRDEVLRKLKIELTKYGFK